MKSYLKTYKIKIPKQVSIFYSEQKQCLILQGQLRSQVFLLQTKVNLLHKLSVIKTTSGIFKKTSKNRMKNLKQMQGSFHSLLKRTVFEVSILLCKKLKLVGVGFKVFLLNYFNKKILHLKLGFSHDIYLLLLENTRVVDFKSNTRIFVLGKVYTDVLKIISLIRLFKKPEPYKGKGVLYEKETVTLKEGKKL